tara:strand:- start:10 stop:1050 length:1041 start_codon:yes stop_codon:yes gene_type:complete
MAYTTIDNPKNHFNTVLYTGNGGTQSVTGVGFKPDWVWIKDRDATLYHYLQDVIRGVGVTLFSNANNGDTTYSASITSFDTDGFTTGSQSATNGSGKNIVSWHWKAGGSASSNSQGSVTSSVSANTTAGFSIVAWTGTGSAETVGHGLGSAPEYIVVKRRDSSGSWYAYHKGIDASAPEDYYVQWHSTGARTDNTTVFNDTSPTPTVFSTGTAIGSSQTFIAYCFRSIKGFSKMSSYVGNGSSDGTFVYTGFQPAYLMVKRSSGTGNWAVYNNKSQTINEMDKQLYYNLSNAEGTSGTKVFDFCANGFKARGNATDTNSSGSTYIYYAVAEAPFVSEGTKAAGTAR